MIPSERFFKSIQDEITLKEKIFISKKLARILGNISNPIQFYSAKNYSLISCLLPYWSAILDEEFENLNLKKIKYDDISSGVVEDLLLKEDQYKILLIQDQLLDPEVDLEWQLSAIRGLEQLGIKVIRVNSFDMAEKHDSSIIEQIQLTAFRLDLQKEKETREIQ